MGPGPLEPQHNSRDSAMYPDAIQHCQSFVMSSPHPSNQQHDCESPIATGSEGLTSFAGYISSETAGYTTMSQALQNSDTVRDLTSAFRTGNTRGPVYPAAYAPYDENYTINDKFDVLAPVLVPHVPLLDYNPAQASTFLDVNDQAPMINTVSSSGVTRSAVRCKRNKRRFTEVEKAAIKRKRRLGVCAGCRKKKRRCTHVLEHGPLENPSIFANYSASALATNSIGLAKIQEGGNNFEVYRRGSVQNEQTTHPAFW
ncbi:hypothetical protein N7G274_006705 [Stereocaulon virgatum]|uniref:Uncharacterized protein n=1 Tax=Stereocaulon virgatum TaxID=373712 RepID=A0ABR4A742_9LECA